MTWLAFRQLRPQLVATAVGLALLAAYLVVLGERLRGAAVDRLLTCSTTDACLTAQTQLHDSFGAQVVLLAVVVLALPALLGAFWGAPLVTRELERGTHLLVWSQSITRARWLGVKLVVVTGAAVVVTGAATALTTWATSPYDRVLGDRFAALEFGSRNLVPWAYAAFACVGGVAVGLLLRRTLPAMAVTVAVMAMLQVAMPLVVRPHLLPATTTSIRFTPDWLAHADFIGPATHDFSDAAPAGIGGYRVPGALMLTSESVLLHADGRALTNAEMARCGDGAGTSRCLAAMDLHFLVRYQPAGRYWPFQLVETGLLLLASAALAGWSLWRISGQRGLA
ncbi:MAG: ABC transporter permease subunit [Nocardioides sp.]